jgi:hypothetical protein
MIPFLSGYVLPRFAIHNVTDGGLRYAERTSQVFHGGRGPEPTNPPYVLGRELRKVIPLAASVVSRIEAHAPAMSDILSARHVLEISHGVVELVARLVVDLGTRWSGTEECQCYRTVHFHGLAATPRKARLKLPIPFGVAEAGQDATASPTGVTGLYWLAPYATEAADAVQALSAGDELPFLNIST